MRRNHTSPDKAQTRVARTPGIAGLLCQTLGMFPWMAVGATLVFTAALLQVLNGILIQLLYVVGGLLVIIGGPKPWHDPRRGSLDPPPTRGPAR